jgi:hypothetical protein
MIPLRRFNRDPWGGVPIESPPRPRQHVPLFLWRGERRLGLLHQRDDLPVAVAAQLRDRGEFHAVLLVDPHEGPDIVATVLASLWQGPRPFGPPGSLMQQRRPVVDIAMHTNAVHPGEQPSVHDRHNVDDPNLMYFIRDSAGTTRQFRVISVGQVRLIPGREAETLKTLPSSSVFQGHVWTVTAFP